MYGKALRPGKHEATIVTASHPVKPGEGIGSQPGNNMDSHMPAWGDSEKRASNNRIGNRGRHALYMHRACLERDDLEG